MLRGGRALRGGAGPGAGRRGAARCGGAGPQEGGEGPRSHPPAPPSIVGSGSRGSPAPPPSWAAGVRSTMSAGAGPGAGAGGGAGGGTPPVLSCTPPRGNAPRPARSARTCVRGGGGGGTRGDIAGAERRWRGVTPRGRAGGAAGDRRAAERRLCDSAEPARCDAAGRGGHRVTLQSRGDAGRTERGRRGVAPRSHAGCAG